MLDGGTNCGKGGTPMAAVHGPGDHWWHRVWSGRTTCGAENLRRDRSDKTRDRALPWCSLGVQLSKCGREVQKFSEQVTVSVTIISILDYTSDWEKEA